MLRNTSILPFSLLWKQQRTSLHPVNIGDAGRLPGLSQSQLYICFPSRAFSMWCREPPLPRVQFVALPPKANSHRYTYQRLMPLCCSKTVIQGRETRTEDNYSLCQRQWWMSTHVQTGGILQAITTSSITSCEWFSFQGVCRMFWKGLSCKLWRMGALMDVDVPTNLVINQHQQPWDRVGNRTN